LIKRRRLNVLGPTWSDDDKAGGSVGLKTQRLGRRLLSTFEQSHPSVDAVYSLYSSSLYTPCPAISIFG
jgi:hypothetical protein